MDSTKYNLEQLVSQSSFNDGSLRVVITASCESSVLNGLLANSGQEPLCVREAGDPVRLHLLPVWQEGNARSS